MRIRIISPGVKIEEGLEDFLTRKIIVGNDDEQSLHEDSNRRLKDLVLIFSKLVDLLADSERLNKEEILAIIKYYKGQDEKIELIG